jgi:hypothetical protein
MVAYGLRRCEQLLLNELRRDGQRRVSMSILPIASLVIAVVGLPLLYYLRRRYTATGLEMRLSREKIIVNQPSASDIAKVAETIAKETSSDTSLSDRVREMREAIEQGEFSKAGPPQKEPKNPPPPQWSALPGKPSQEKRPHPPPDRHRNPAKALSSAVPCHADNPHRNFSDRLSVHDFVRAL